MVASRTAGGFLVAILVAGLLAACKGEGDDDHASTDPAAQQAAEAERTGFPVEVANDLGMRFRLVPAETFTMGSPETEPGRRDDEVRHEVWLLRAHYVQATEVTNGWYRRFRPGHSSGVAPSGASLDGDDQPVVNVTWDDAVAFAAWLTEQDPRFVYRLPTEAEWEHACRAGVAAPFACEHPVVATTASRAVGRGSANPWGLFDMHDNVAEWVHDRYGPYPLWLHQNPQGASTGEERVVRGASWADEADAGRSAARGRLPPGERRSTVGFRLAFGLGYGRTDYGRYTVELRTIDPTVDAGEPRDRPGWSLCMISVVDRLTDRVNQIQETRWVPLKHPSPIVLHLAPGIYYVCCFRMEGEHRVRSFEMKFQIPGPDVVECPIPRKWQAHPQ